MHKTLFQYMSKWSNQDCQTLLKYQSVGLHKTRWLTRIDSSEFPKDYFFCNINPPIKIRIAISRDTIGKTILTPLQGGIVVGGFVMSAKKSLIAFAASVPYSKSLVLFSAHVIWPFLLPRNMFLMLTQNFLHYPGSFQLVQWDNFF